ncbi:hypothetical protein NNA36_04205 [Shimia sp. CNT1-13L.2]|uniref:hypothetical protein n=1 Tax=Shimia sp. CNT1-13L.2 TaxID=2959663 RepID=UPI0020CDA026|nr:hypothetical protein [Shimia sp. CNT1-13L.2]MCP9481157.1 hypothetical protein [Shimia sp. CNT1-13L.2]
MSNPVTNVEIEDVLSSIRRLVSEGSRTAPAEDMEKPETAIVPEVAATPEPEIDDRLVLTPALRVAEVEDEPSDDILRSVEADLEAIEDGASEEVEAALSEAHDHAWEDPGATFEVAEAVEEAPFVAVEDVAEDEVEDGIALERAKELDARIVRWEHLSEIDAAPYEPDEAGDSEYAGTDVERLQWEDAEEVEAPEVETAAEPDIAPEDAAPAVEALEERVAELSDEDAETSEDVLEGLAQQLEQEAVSGVHRAVETAAADEMDLGDLNDDSVVTLDEGSLRDLVADIVRQELQGALGERITRNVRKLVRREIHRALAAHDLD